MRNKILFLFSVILAIGCGTKKHTTYRPVSKPLAKHSEPVLETGETLYVLPEDTGEFVRFPISGIEHYISTFAEIAQFEMKAYGIPASITLAQGILESGYGQGELTLKTNNHFGIKCHTGWEGAFETHDDDARGECFRKYNHPMYSFRDHSIFLSSRSRYADLFDLRPDDYKGWAYGLKKAGYATDPRYPHKLIAFIESYGLHQYDKEVLEQGYALSREPRTTTYGVHVVRKGDTLYALSRQYYMTVSELMEINNLKDASLRIGQQLRIRSSEINK